MQGHRFYFCLALTAHYLPGCSHCLRLDSEVELEENKCVNFDLLTAHTPAPGLLKGLQTPAAVVDGKTGSQVIRNRFDLC